MRTGIFMLISIIYIYRFGFSVEHLDSTASIDSLRSLSSIKEFVQLIQFHGHVRNFFMATSNRDQLSDYYANATGAALGGVTPKFRGFQLGIKGLFTFNTFSNDLNHADPVAHASAGWEKDLFDVMHPEKKKDLDRLEELYLSYDHKRFWLVVGKQDINDGPLLQRRDTRMKPFVYKGIYTKILLDSSTTMTGAIFTHVSPRGMTEWYSMSEAIGLLNNGLMTDGSSVDYHDKVGRSYLIEHGIVHENSKKTRIELWNYLLSGYMHTTWAEINSRMGGWNLGLQYAQQFACGEQYRLPQNQRYFHANTSQTIAARVERSFGKRMKVSFSTLHGIGEGMFLFPRELNRDAFFTSIPRSRVEGNGKAHVYLLNTKYQPLKGHFKELVSTVSVQFSDLASINDHVNNKYGLPDYVQLNVEFRYPFKGLLNGLELSALYVYRTSSMTEELALAQSFNKTDFHHFNLILDIVF